MGTDSLKVETIDGTYTRMLRQVQNLSWKDIVSKKSIYGNLKPITETIRERRLRLAGHVHRDKSSLAHNTILWQLKHSTVARSR